MDQIRVVHGDTDLVAEGEGTMGSRSLQLGGSAVHKASVGLVEKAKQVAADALEANPDDVVLDKATGRFTIAGTPAIGRSWAELATASAGMGDPLAVITDFQANNPTFPFGAHVAVVEIDPATGQVELSRYVAVDDCGNQINPMIVAGQVHGGIAYGVGQALFEHAIYDDNAQLVTGELLDYAVPKAHQLPSYELDHTVTPCPHNPLGVKGIGEAGTIASPAAVVNAVVDALSGHGVLHLDMPLTPERVWRALQSHSEEGH
jgi:carbon-monoxide dehydrogenase large subunit